MHKHFKILLLSICLLTSSLSLQSQNWGYFELEGLSNLSEAKGPRPQVDIYFSQIADDARIGYYYFALANKNWGQAYGGITFMAANWLKINLGAGLETDADPYRFNITFFAYHKNLSLLQIYEYGGSGLWYRIRANMSLGAHHNIGLLAERYYGVGPIYEYKPSGLPLGFLGAFLMDPEDGDFNLLTSIRYYL